MNTELIASNIKGKEEVSMSLFPSNTLEREYFNTLFSSEVVVTQVKDKILIQRKSDVVKIDESPA